MMLSYAATGWSLFTILTPFAARVSYPALLLCRVLMGFAEGVAFPGVFHFLAGWVPSNERARCIGLFMTGVHVGTTVALVVSPWIIKMFSWEMIFYSFGAAGFVWIAAWNLLAYDKDGRGKEQPDHEAPSADAEGHVSGKMRGDAGLGDLKIVLWIFRKRETAVVCLVQMIYALIHYTILSWLPTYFKNVYNVETANLSFTFMPYFAMVLFSNVGGYIADMLLQRGMPLTRVRKLITTIANTGAACMLICFSLSNELGVALGFISASMAFMALNTGGWESVFMDMASVGMVGMFKATANTFASLAGAVAIPLATIILDLANGSWRITFASLSLWFFVMTGAFLTWGSADRVLTEESR